MREEVIIMKRNKIIGISIATLGIIFSIGGAFALYEQGASETGFGIGAGAYSGSTSTVTYQINGNGGASNVVPHYCDEYGVNGGLGIDANHPQVKYEFALGAEFANDLPAQTYVMGNLSVNFTGLNSTFYNKVQVYAAIEGYSADTCGMSSFGSAIINNVTIENNETVCSGSRVVSVASSGLTHKLVVWVKFNLAGVDTLAQNELTNLYNLSVTWGDVPADYDACAYIVGTGNSWTVDDEFRMSVDPTKPVWTYRYDGLTGSQSWTACKAVKTSTRAGDISKWSAGENNFALENGTTYSLYWEEPTQDSQVYSV